MQGQASALTRGHAMFASHHQRLMQLNLMHVLPKSADQQSHFCATGGVSLSMTQQMAIHTARKTALRDCAMADRIASQGNLQRNPFVGEEGLRQSPGCDGHAHAEQESQPCAAW